MNVPIFVCVDEGTPKPAAEAPKQAAATPEEQEAPPREQQVKDKVSATDNADEDEATVEVGDCTHHWTCDSLNIYSAFCVINVENVYKWV